MRVKGCWEWPLTPKIDRATWAFLKFDIRHGDWWHATGAKNYSDMWESLFLNSTCDIRENKRQWHATLPFLLINLWYWGSPVKGPLRVRRPEESRKSGQRIYRHQLMINSWCNIQKLAFCIIFYDSAQRYERFHPLHKVMRTKNRHNIYVRLYLRFYFWNNYCTLWITTLFLGVTTVF